MGKSKRNILCSICNEIKNGVEVWGKLYCFECYKEKPKRKGHSGMTLHKDLDFSKFVTLSSGITLECVKKSHPVFSTLYLTHYPGSKGIFGRSINYIVRKDGEVAGIISVNSPPLNYKKFVNFFGNGITELNYVNNNAFRLILHEKNFGTQVLRLFRKTIKKDYFNKYGDSLVGIITFVEEPRDGAIYKADNWKYLGKTQGISVKRANFADENFINKEFISDTTIKLIFAKTLK